MALRFRFINRSHGLLPVHAFSTMPGYAKPLPLDVRTGKLRRNLDDKQKDSMRKRNKTWRRYLTSTRRNMSRELLFGYAATRMMNKLAIGANQKRLQKELVNHLYALKLNSFRLPFMEIEEQQGDTDDTASSKKTIRLTRRLRSNSSWNQRQKKKGAE